MNKSIGTHGFLWRKIFLTMKFVFVFMLLGICNSFAGSYAQNEKLSVKMQQATFDEIVSAIEKQSDYVFFYKSSDVDHNVLYNVDLENRNIHEILNQLMANSSLSYRISGKYIFIEKKESKENTTVHQKKQVSGTITDEFGEPVIGANVVEKGTTNGTVTDIDGNFTLGVESGAVLQVSYLGYLTQDIVVGNNTQLTITLQEDTRALDEVIVIGYGVQRKSDLTGAVSSVKSDDLPPSATTSVEHMLSGKAAGVQITSLDSQPGGGIEILIRGATSSQNTGNTPLYIIDGFPVGGHTDPGTGNRYSIGTRSPLNSINPNDIESIEILKDASATAIYGARAANGVILITTKQGKKGKVQLNYDYKFGVQNMTDDWVMMDAPENMTVTNTYRRERWMQQHGIGVYGGKDPSSVPAFVPIYSDAEIAGAGKGTDWLDEVTRTGILHEHNLSISGASDATNYLISLNVYDQTGIVKANDFNRITGRMNLTQEIRSWLNVGVRATGSRIKINNPALGSGGSEYSGIMESAMSFSPMLPIKDENGNYTQVPNASFFPNPVSLLAITNETTQNRLLVQSFVEMRPMKDLLIRAQYGFDQQHATTNSYLPKTTVYGAAVGGDATIRQANRFDTMFNTIVSYNKSLNDMHSLNAMVGYEWQVLTNDGHDLRNYNFPTDAFLTNNIGAGEAPKPGVSSYKGATELASYFGRLNYNYSDRYLLTLTFRADGSDRFGVNNRWGYFPSGAIAWRIDQEEFMQSLDWLSNAKLRLSVGQTGNSNISGAYAYYSFGRNYMFGSEKNSGTYLSSYANDQLKWETTTEYNIGFDLGFINNRINLTLELYSKEVDDLLNTRRLKYYLPNDRVNANVGTTSSKGYELSITTINVNNKELFWSSNLNLSGYKDKWKKRSPDVTLASYESITDPLRVTWGYILDGLVQPGESVPHMPNAIPGTQKIKDIAGYNERGELIDGPDGVINDADRILLYNQDPSMIVGFSNTLRYKNFDLNVHMYGLLGWTKHNAYLSSALGMNPNLERQYNFPRVDMSKFYSSEYPNATYPSLFFNSPFPGASQFVHEKADFIRVKNITLGYNFDNIAAVGKWFNSARLYVDIANPFVFTKFTQIDPEHRFDSSAGATYPTSKTVTVGVNLQF